MLGSQRVRDFAKTHLEQGEFINQLIIENRSIDLQRLLNVVRLRENL